MKLVLQFNFLLFMFLVLLMQLRSEVNKVLENARIGKLIGSSLDAKVFLHATDGATIAKLEKMCMASNDADSLHRIFITSKVKSESWL